MNDLLPESVITGTAPLCLLPTCSHKPGYRNLNFCLHTSQSFLADSVIWWTECRRLFFFSAAQLHLLQRRSDLFERANAGGNARRRVRVCSCGSHTDPQRWTGWLKSSWEGCLPSHPKGASSVLTGSVGVGTSVRATSIQNCWSGGSRPLVQVRSFIACKRRIARLFFPPTNLWLRVVPALESTGILGILTVSVGGEASHS